jgi:hypothetical protein
MEIEFFRRILENAEISNFMTIRLIGAELVHADRRIDMTKITVAFHNAENAAKMG